MRGADDGRRAARRAAHGRVDTSRAGRGRTGGRPDSGAAAGTARAAGAALVDPAD